MVNIFKHFLNFFLALTLQAIFIANLFAANSDLIEIYEKAVNYDALLSASRYQNEATKELINQGRSLFLPSMTNKFSKTSKVWVGYSSSNTTATDTNVIAVGMQNRF